MERRKRCPDFGLPRVSKVLPCAESAVPYAEFQVPPDHSGLPYPEPITVVVLATQTHHFYKNALLEIGHTPKDPCLVPQFPNCGVRVVCPNLGRRCFDTAVKTLLISISTVPTRLQERRSLAGRSCVTGYSDIPFRT